LFHAEFIFCKTTVKSSNAVTIHTTKPRRVSGVLSTRQCRKWTFDRSYPWMHWTTCT